MKMLSLLFTMVAFAVVLLVVYTLHAWYFPVNVVLYSAVFDSFVATAICAALLFMLRPIRSVFSATAKILILAVWLLGGYAFAISVPTVLDRSLSFYILEKLDQRGGGILHGRFSQVFTQEYLTEYRLVDVRLTEQLESGTVVIEDGCVRLTSWGEQLASISRFLRQNWLPKQRLLAGTYSSQLTEPLKVQPNVRLGYEC